MREIKFKAFLRSNQRLPNGITLGYKKFPRGIYEAMDLNLASEIVTLWSEKKQTSFEVSFCKVELLQYTGEKDKNGKEIYDGYILRLDRDELLKNLEPEDVPDDTLIQVVAFENGAFTARSRSGIKWGSVGGMFEYGEIIGNIYENPELLQ